MLLTASCILPSDQKVKKGKEGRDPVDMVKFSKVKKVGSRSKMSMSFVYIISTSDYIVYCTAAQTYVWFLSVQSPIQESLIDFSDSGMNRVAADIFIGEKRVRIDAYRRKKRKAEK